MDEHPDEPNEVLFMKEELFNRPNSIYIDYPECSVELQNFFNAVSELQYEDTPDYNRLRKIFEVTIHCILFI